MARGALEWRILSDILRDKNMLPALRNGLASDHFRDPEARQIWDHVMGHYNNPSTAREFPSIRSLKNRWPSFSMTPKGGDEDAELSTLIWELKVAALGTDMRALADEFSDLVDSDPVEALSALRSHLSQVSYNFENKGGFRFDEVVNVVRESYENEHVEDMYTFGFPWECLTYDLRGKKPGDFFLFYARAKMMKTWILLWQAVHDFLVNKKKVVIWSREMSKEELCLRIGSIVAKVCNECLEHRILPPHVAKRAWKELERVKALVMRSNEEAMQGANLDRADLLVMAGRGTPRELTTVQSAAETFGCESLYLDSYYHLEGPRGGRSDQERLRYLTEDVKSVSIDGAWPTTATSQANKEGEQVFGESMRDIFRTDAASQECDAVFKLFKKKVTEIHEEDYEGYWDSQEKLAEKRTQARAVMVPISGRATPRKARTAPVKVRRPRNPRVAAEVVIYPAGQRRGTGDGFLIKAQPGYNCEVVREGVTPEDVKQWYKEQVEAETDNAQRKRPMKSQAKNAHKYTGSPANLRKMRKQV